MEGVWSIEQKKKQLQVQKIKKNPASTMNADTKEYFEIVVIKANEEC